MNKPPLQTERWIEGGAIEMPRRPRTVRIEPTAAPITKLERCARCLRRFFRIPRNPFTR